MAFLIDFEDFSRLFESAGIVITKKNYGKFSRYAELLVETNKKFNLTAITDPQGIAEKHFLDSLLPLKIAEIPDNAQLADVGTGAGFPGVPLKIMRPDLNLVLIDSLQKRVNFLSMLTSELGFEAECLHVRAEDAGRGELGGRFDVVTARAVSRLDKLAGYCLPLLKRGGVMLALKGSDIEEEVGAAGPALKKYRGEVEGVVKYALPSGDGRALVIVRKK